ncbi:MAG: hypothetical protein JJU45_06195 [Acidimicrobiia bacterium]|nr:hypothetical protein [Acidimicrobiia bacterium]
MTGATTSTGIPGVVCITGMHRSGTSLLAGLLEQCGLDLGDPEALLPPGQDNPRGYWEHRAIKELDDELLGRLGGTWDQPPVLDDGWATAPGLDDLRQRASETLGSVFGSTGRRRIVGFKDPRASLLLPFWQTVAPITATVAVIRDPREVARSLEARNALPPPQSALLWLRYLAAAIHDAPNLLLVTHRSLFDDLDPTLRTICRHLALAEPSAATLAGAARLVDPSLRHHSAPTGHEARDNPLVALAHLVFGDGDVDLHRLDPLLVDAIRRGWLRPPPDTLLLDHARARMVQMEATMRARRRRAMARAAAASESSSASSTVAVDERSAVDSDPASTTVR